MLSSKMPELNYVVYRCIVGGKIIKTSKRETRQDGSTSRGRRDEPSEGTLVPLEQCS